MNASRTLLIAGNAAGLGQALQTRFEAGGYTVVSVSRSGDILASEFEKFLQQSYGSNGGNSPAANGQTSTGASSEDEKPREGDEPEI